MSESYRLSGTVPLGGGLLTLFLGACASLAGIAYAYGTRWIPVAYFNIVMTAGLGYVVGKVVSTWSLKTHFRAPFAAAFLGFLCGLLALYFAWVFDPVARVGWGNIPLSFDPRFLQWYVGQLYEFGSWSWDDNEPVKGIPLAIVWFIESAVVLAIATVMPWLELADRIYCEHCNDWCQIASGVRLLSPANAPEIANEANAGNFAPLLAAAPSHPDDVDYLRLTLVSCPTCDTSHYLSVRLVTYRANAQGVVTENIHSLVDLRPIGPADAARLRDSADDDDDAESEDSADGPA